MRRCLVLIVLLSGCATGQFDTKGYWEPKNALHWDRARIEGAHLLYEDGSRRHIPAQVIDNLVGAHERVASASGMGWIALGLLDLQSGAVPVFQAFAGKEQGAPIVAVSLGLLETIGDDPDALAAVLGHEFAHISLGHVTEAKLRQERLKQSQQVGAGLTTGPAAIAALIFRVGALVHYRSLSREDERAADERGLQFAIKAGFDPCGMVRALAATGSLENPSVPFFSTHPGGGDRRELADRYSRQVNQRECPAPAPVVAARAVGAERASDDAPVAAPEPEPSESQKRYRAAIEAGRADGFVSAVPEIRSLAEAGYAPAQASLGFWYFTGLAGLSRDEVQAVRWARLAADQGHAGAQVSLGRAHMRGSGGLSKDEREAVRLFRLAAQQGYAPGEANLGLAYAQGLGGLSKDLLQAARYFSRAAEKGEASAQVNLAWIYWRGTKGIPTDAVEAVRLFRLAVEQNNASGQAGLAEMHFLGAGGLRVDEAEALRLFRAAAEQGNAFAQDRLGAMRENGMGGLPKDVEEAVSWYRRAAAQGHKSAIESLKRLEAGQSGR